MRKYIKTLNTSLHQFQYNTESWLLLHIFLSILLVLTENAAATMQKKTHYKKHLKYQYCLL